MKADAWGRAWFNFGGINREVTLRRLGPSELDAPGVQTRLAPGGTAVVDVTARLRNRAPWARTLRAAGSLGGVPLRFAPVRLEARRAAWLRARVRLAHPALWSPQHPRLLRLRLAVPGESGYGARVGLRELRWNDGRLRLNGRHLVLRGASIHEDAAGRGDALRARDMDAVVARLRAIGANATRAQHPLSPALLERLDAAGILVWQGIGPVDSPGAWTSTTPARRARAERRARLSVLQVHPSVIAWNLANEIAFNGHRGGQAAYVARAAGEARRLDPGRPVALDLWGTHLPSVAGAIWRHVDAVGATNYQGWYAQPGAPAAVTRGAIAAFLARLHRLFPDKVVAITEFGAEANRQNAADAPGGVGYQARLLAESIGAYRDDPRLDGMLVWNLQDFALTPRFDGGSIRGELPDIRLRRGINQKGLFTYGGEPKPAALAVARAFRSGR
jgi:beta-galactosidase/beta-glucuronidase